MRAVKEGLVLYEYDTRFVFAEVNADKFYWLVDNNRHARLNEVRRDEYVKLE